MRLPSLFVAVLILFDPTFSPAQTQDNDIVIKTGTFTLKHGELRRFLEDSYGTKVNIVSVKTKTSGEVFSFFNSSRHWRYVEFDMDKNNVTYRVRCQIAMEDGPKNEIQSGFCKSRPEATIDKATAKLNDYTIVGNAEHFQAH